MIMTTAFRAPLVCRHFRAVSPLHRALHEVDMVTAISQRKKGAPKVGNWPQIRTCIQIFLVPRSPLSLHPIACSRKDKKHLQMVRELGKKLSFLDRKTV